jgi:hypothetical protein
MTSTHQHEIAFEKKAPIKTQNQQNMTATHGNIQHTNYTIYGLQLRHLN